MRGLYIFCEGQTEEEFVNSCLLPFFAQAGIYDSRAFLMQTSPGAKGGDVSYQRYKRNVELLLKSENDIIVSSLIDFYKLRTDFPGYDEANRITDKMQRVQFLEDAIRQDIPHRRFIPYIQLHEFEGLLFSDVQGFGYIPNISPGNLEILHQTVAAYPNPELLNDGEETAPSKRLQQLIPSYRKVLHGSIIAKSTSLPVMMGKCVRFRAWVEGLIAAMKMTS